MKTTLRESLLPMGPGQPGCLFWLLSPRTSYTGASLSLVSQTGVKAPWGAAGVSLQGLGVFGMTKKRENESMGMVWIRL